MGLRLYVAKEYKVKWAGSGYFDNNLEEFKSLLNEIGLTMFCLSGSTLEIDKEDFIKAVSNLRNIDSLDKKDKVSNILKELGHTCDEVIDIMNTLYNESDPDLSYMRLSFF